MGSNLGPGNTERRIQRSRSTKCQKRHETTCFRSFQGLLIGSDGWFMASKMKGSVLGKFDSSQTSKSPEPFVLPAPCGEPTGEINQTHCGLGGRVQLAHLKKSRCCIWDVGTIWEPSGNHLGKAEKKLVPHSAPTLQLYAASLYW